MSRAAWRARIGVSAAVAAVAATWATVGWVRAEPPTAAGQEEPVKADAGAAPAPVAPAPSPAAPVLKGPVAPNDSVGEAEDVEPASATPGAGRPTLKADQPVSRPRYAVAVLQVLDKVTAETMRFEAPVNQPVRYKTLVFTVRACETTAPDEADLDAAAHVEIDSQPGPGDPGGGRQLFRGWMFAQAPGLNLFEHPAYDAWVIACKAAAPSA